MCVVPWIDAVQVDEESVSYEQKYMTVLGLGKALDAWKSGDIEFTPKQKNNMRGKKRSGFRTFLRETIGDFSIAIAILRHGKSFKHAKEPEPKEKNKLMSSRENRIQNSRKQPGRQDKSMPKARSLRTW